MKTGKERHFLVVWLERIIVTIVFIFVGITLLEIVVGLPNRFMTEDKTLGKSDICEIHHSRMQRMRVVKDFGLPGWHPSEPTWETKKAFFSHAATNSWGGCVVSSLTAKYAFIFVCPECQAK